MNNLLKRTAPPMDQLIVAFAFTLLFLVYASMFLVQ
jgi:hypothetical protein